jgi:glycerol-3-phosphate acyltransferase PlsY
MDAVGLLAISLAYTLGCCNASYYLVRWKTGDDLRVHGSGNAGARNVGRLLGPAWFALAFVLDAAKGAAATAIGASAAPAAPVAAGCALAAVVGHVWPAQLGWRGGKGIATAMGGTLALSMGSTPPGWTFVLPALAVLVLWTHRRNLSRSWRHFTRARRGDIGS